MESERVGDMGKRVSNKRGKWGARTRVHYGWRVSKIRAYDELVKGGMNPLIAWRSVYG